MDPRLSGREQAFLAEHHAKKQRLIHILIAVGIGAAVILVLALVYAIMQARDSTGMRTAINSLEQSRVSNHSLVTPCGDTNIVDGYSTPTNADSGDSCIILATKDDLNAGKTSVFMTNIPHADDGLSIAKKAFRDANKQCKVGNLETVSKTAYRMLADCGYANTSNRYHVFYFVQGDRYDLSMIGFSMRAETNPAPLFYLANRN